jgi:hypothetical protein
MTEHATKLLHIVLSSVSEVTTVQPKTIIEKTRDKEHVEARHISMALLYQHTNLTLKVIGKLFGNRDHTTVLNSSIKAQDFNQYDKHFKQVYDKCEALFLNGLAEYNADAWSEVYNGEDLDELILKLENILFKLKQQKQDYAAAKND